MPLRAQNATQLPDVDEDFFSPSGSHFFGLADDAHKYDEETLTPVAMLQNKPPPPVVLTTSKRVPTVEPPPPEPLRISVVRIPTQTTDLPFANPLLISANRLSRMGTSMDLQDLHHLVDSLSRNSMQAMTISAQFARSLTANKASIVPMETPDTGLLGKSGVSSITSFHNITDRMVSLASRQSFFDGGLGDSKINSFTLSRLQQNANDAGGQPSMQTTSGPLPREAVAVLIDAVRASVLDENEKCRFLFELFDVDRQGLLSGEGVTEFINATLLASNLQLYGDVQCQDIVDKIFSATALTQQMTYLEFCEAFGPVLEDARASQAPESKIAAHATGNAAVRENTNNARSIASRIKTLPQKLRQFYRKHDAEIVYLTAYFLILIAAFFIKAYFVKYDAAVGYCPKIAKGFAQVIMVNTLFLLLPMCRNFVAFLRRFAAISSRVPVDQNIEFHKICGVVMLLASLGHTVAWIAIVYNMRTVPDGEVRASNFSHLAFVREQSVISLMPRIPIWTGVAMVLMEDSFSDQSQI